MINKYYEQIDNPEKIILNENLEVYCVKPEESINLLYNPEVVDLTGYTFVPQISSSGLIQLYNEEQYVGINSIKATLFKDDLIRVAVNNTLESGQVYTFSVYIKNESLISIYLINNSNLRVTNLETFKTNNYWSRYTFTFQPQQNYTDAKIAIKCESLATEIYLDAFQLEPKAYATTFISGNLSGFSNLEIFNPYFWLGVPNKSPSVRLGTTKSGGKLVSLNKLGIDILGFIGLGMPQVSYNIQSLALNNSSHYQGFSIENRNFSILLSIIGKDQKDYIKIRNELISLFSPSQSQLTKLIFELKENGNVNSDQYELDVLYNKGLEGAYNNMINENISLDFTMIDPFIKSSKSTTIKIDPFTSLPFTFNPSVINNPIYTNSTKDRQWQEIAQSNANIRVEIANKIITAQNNLIYIIGKIRNVSENKNYLMAEWNGKSLIPKLEIVSGTQGFDAVLGKDNNMYIVGDFITIKNNLQTITRQYLPKLNIIRYDILYNNIFKVFESNNNIRSIDTKNDELFFVGGYTQLAYTSTINYINHIGKFNIKTNAFTVLGGTSITLGANEYLSVVKCGKDNKVWFGGNFSYSGLDQNIAYIELREPGNLFYPANPLRIPDSVTFSSGLSVSNCSTINQTFVNCIEITDNNEVYIGGAFNSTRTLENAGVNSGSLQRPVSIAKWNGVTWEPLQILLKNIFPSAEVAIVRSIKFNKINNQLYVGGDIAYAGKRYETVYDPNLSPFAYNYERNTSGLAIWTGSSWLPYPFSLADTNNRANTNIRGIISAIEFIGQYHNPIYSPSIYPTVYPVVSTSDFGTISTLPDSILFTLQIDSISVPSSLSVTAFLSKYNNVDTKCSKFTNAKFVITGPGKIKWLKNNNNRYIHFNQYSIKENEEVTIDLTRLIPSVTSSFVGDIKNIINVTSSLNTFKLEDGKNLIEFFVLPDANTANIYVTFKTQLLSIDQLYNTCD